MTKRVELKVSGDLNYKTNIIGILKTPKDPQAGTTHEEMTYIIPLIVKIEAIAEGDFVDLSNPEHREIVDRFKNARFVTNSPEIYEMIDDIEHSEGPLKAVGPHDLPE
jgi:hypothetical protein